jgi:hypothetical protein
LGESYTGIRTLADFSAIVIYTNRPSGVVAYLVETLSSANQLFGAVAGEYKPGGDVSKRQQGWRKPRPQYKKDEVAPTKPKVKAFNRRHQPKTSKETNKTKGEKKTEIKNTPVKASLTSSRPKKTKV